MTLFYKIIADGTLKGQSQISNQSSINESWRKGVGKTVDCLFIKSLLCNLVDDNSQDTNVYKTF